MEQTLKKMVKCIGAVSAVSAGISFVRDQISQKTNENGHKPAGVYEEYLKVPLDAAISSAALMVLSPVMIATSAAIKATSDGPVFFKQERVGKDQKVFYIYKFRTMIQNAEHIGDGIKVKSEDDPRITPVGKILRKTSLDELPQFINILKGEMSIIGPRPPVTYKPYNVGEYDERRKHRFDVKPGITGLAQAKIRNMGTWDERIEYDLEYVEDITLKNEFKIIWDTVKIVMDTKNIYRGK